MPGQPGRCALMSSHPVWRHLFPLAANSATSDESVGARQIPEPGQCGGASRASWQLGGHCEGAEGGAGILRDANLRSAVVGRERAAGAASADGDHRTSAEAFSGPAQGPPICWQAGLPEIPCGMALPMRARC